MNLRWVIRDGEKVLQQLIHTNPVPKGQLVYREPKYEWQDVPTVKEGEE